ncbi:MAG: lysozyme inhibitor LprI family protein [Pseudomonadota bacterium]|nr:lysozyme inhibitor LprI family protein [Pseudomonadota bacterium]
MKKRWMGLVLCLTFGQVQAASFDCGKAGTKVEKLICADDELSKLDEVLATAYADALKSPDPASLKTEQKAWLKVRNRCADVACIQAAYRQRTEALSQALLPPAPAAQPAPPIQTPLVPAATEPACLPPRIDWRNYQWTLITGNGMTACEEMLTYLKARPKEAPPPVCPDERLPPNGNWTRPELRVLSEAEKQALIREIPEKWRKNYEQEFKKAELMRVIRADITRDGVPETLLAYTQRDNRKTCARSTRCAETDGIARGYISLGEADCDNYRLLAMNDAGTQVDWQHKTVAWVPMLREGELVYYKGRPYWLSYVGWFQGPHDNFVQNRMPTNDQNSRIFMLSAVISGPKPGMNFKDVRGVDHLDDPACRFGYFHHNALKLHPPKGR